MRKQQEAQLGQVSEYISKDRLHMVARSRPQYLEIACIHPEARGIPTSRTMYLLDTGEETKSGYTREPQLHPFQQGH